MSKFPRYYNTFHILLIFLYYVYFQRYCIFKFLHERGLIIALLSLFSLNSSYFYISCWKYKKYDLYDVFISKRAYKFHISNLQTFIYIYSITGIFGCLHRESDSLKKEIIIKGNTTHCQLTPSAMQTRNPIVAFDSFSTFETFAVTISLDPMVRHRLRRLFAFHVGGYARGWCSLHAPFMDSVLADYIKRERLVCLLLQCEWTKLLVLKTRVTINSINNDILYENCSSFIANYQGAKGEKRTYKKDGSSSDENVF